VFDSFGAYLRVKLWSDYFTHRATLADWVVQNMLTRSVARHSHAFCTCANEQERKYVFHLLGSQYHKEKRLDIFDGGLTLDPVKYDNTPSCAVVHDFFTDTTDSTDTSSSPGIQLDALMRDDFRAYLQTSLPGTQIVFDMEQIEMTKPETGYTESRHRAVLHIDVLPPAVKAISPTPVPVRHTTVGAIATASHKFLGSQPVAATSVFTTAQEAFDAADHHQAGPVADDRDRYAGVATPDVSPRPPQHGRRIGSGQVLNSLPSKDTFESTDDEVAQLALPKSNSMFAQSKSRDDFGRQDAPPHGSLSLPNAQSYDEKVQRKEQHPKNNQPHRFIRPNDPKQEKARRNAPAQQQELIARRNDPTQLARRVGAGVELRPTPSVDHIYIELGTDTHHRHQTQSRLPPRSPRSSPIPRNATSSTWNDAQNNKAFGIGHAAATPLAVATAAAAAVAEEPLPAHSRRKPHARKSDERPRYATDTEDSLFHMSDIETDPHVPVGVVVAARNDVESVASTLSGPLTVDDWPSINHAKSFATPVDTLSVADNDRVSVKRQTENKRSAPQIPKAHLAELQELSPAEQEDFYRWQQRQLQRRRLQQQQQQSGQYQCAETPASTPDRSSSLFTQQPMSVCQNVAWLDYLCEAMGVPGSEEKVNSRNEAARWRQQNASAPMNYRQQPQQLTPATSADETSSPPVVVPQVRRTATYPEMDPSPSTAWISDAFNFVRSVFEGDGSVTTVPQDNRPRPEANDDHVIRARSPTLVIDHFERNSNNHRPGVARQQVSEVHARFGENDWDDRDTIDSDKYRALLNDSGSGYQRQKRVSFDQQDALPVVVKAKSWSQPFHIVAGQEPARAISPRNNPRSIPLRERPPVDRKTMSKGNMPNKRPQSAPRSTVRRASQPQKSASEDKGEKKRGVGLKGLFGFRRKKNVATD
jgi:hypothetical protein